MSSPGPRHLACARCGAAFECTLSDACWCARQPIALPVPEAGSGGDCLCADCLKAAAEATRPAAAPTR